MSVLRDAARVYKESLGVLLVSLVGGLFAGSVLGTEGMTAAFEEFPGLLLLLPAFLAVRGNVYGALGARISSGIHQGIVPARFERNRRLVNAVFASVFNGLTISVFVAVAAWGILIAAGRSVTPLPELVGIVLVAAVLTSFVMITGLLLLLFEAYRRGVDPDNLVGPIVTTLGDVFGVLFLYVGVLVVRWLT